MTTNGFLLGKFMPPHAGHIALAEAAASMCDSLTILVCWLPDDPIPGEIRLGWMRELFPHARVVGHGEVVPQEPEDSADFWPIWRAIMRGVHPERIDFVFAGEDYGKQLAEQVGGMFVPLGARVLEADGSGVGGISASAIRDDPAAHWAFLPPLVKSYYSKVVVLHGAESTGKSTMAQALAAQLGGGWVPEYGRSHCAVHGTDLALRDLQIIAAAQQGMIEAAKPWNGPILPCDTDWLMTRAWNQMLFGEALKGPEYATADLYLLMPEDRPWVDDGLRMFGEREERAKFAAICREELVRADVRWEELQGDPRECEAAALAHIAAL